MDLDAQERLVEYVRRGGCLIIGPGMPYLDPALRPARRLADHLAEPGSVKIGAGQLIWCSGDRLAAIIPEVTPLPEFRCDQPDINLSVHFDQKRTFLFIANPTSTPKETQLSFKGAVTLHSVWGEEQTIAGQGHLTLDIPPYTVQIQEVLRD
jgi:hypothetical protein